jgi:Holliday junction resolvasome RuvABC endonuclease subunit
MPAPGGVLAIDASPRCGLAYGVFGQRPVWWNLDLGKIDRPGAVYNRLFTGIHDAIKIHQPSQIVYEAPFAPQQQSNAKVGLVLIGLCAIIEFTAERYSLPCSHLAVQTARSKVLGRNPTGGPEKVKPIIVAWAKGRGWDTRCHDEADALCMLAHSIVVADRTGRAHYNRHGELL